MIFGLAPVMAGPIYIFRNVGKNWWDTAIKMGGHSDGYAYLYHNTFHTEINTSVFADFGHTDVVDNFVSRNNIMQVGKYAIHQRHPDTTNSYDYDNAFKGPWGGLFRWGPDWPGDIYDTLAEFQAVSGQEPHGISADPEFIDPDTFDYELQSTSSCIDAGIALPGFNDANSPWPHTGSAPDMGAYEYGLGASNHAPSLDYIGDRTEDEGELLQFTISATDPDGDNSSFSVDRVFLVVLLLAVLVLAVLVWRLVHRRQNILQ
jgi:hypothetical protein